MYKYKLTTTLIILGFFQLSFLGFKSKTPPGTKYCKELKYYVDKNEIDVLSWWDFMHWMRKDFGDSIANTLLPDTLIIKKVYGKNIFSSNATTIKYFRFPIIGVSSTQIEAYCKFRTNVVNKGSVKNVNYTLYDKNTYTFLNKKFKPKVSKVGYKSENKLNPKKRFRGLFTNAPELVKYDKTYKVLLNNNSLVDLKDNTTPFTFRCIAKY